MKVVVELSLQGDNGVGMGSKETYVTQELFIEEWIGGNSTLREEYVKVKDRYGNHLFDIRMGTRGQVYVEVPKDGWKSDIITIRGEQ